MAKLVGNYANLITVTLTLGDFQLEAMHITDAWNFGGKTGNLLQNVLSFCAQTGDIWVITRA